MLFSHNFMTNKTDESHNIISQTELGRLQVFAKLAMLIFFTAKTIT